MLEEGFECKLTGDHVDESFSRSREGREELRGRDRSAVQSIALGCLELGADLHSPFGVYLKGGPGELERRLREAHEVSLSETIGRLDGEYRALFKGALALLYPEVTKKTMFETELLQAVLPAEAPDPDDFW